jgi:hypothetical protein
LDSLEQKKKNLPKHIRKVVELIPIGFERPRTVREISKLTGFSPTAVRTYVHTAIVTYEIPIGASNFKNKPGYYIIQTQEEKEKAINNLSSRIREMSKRVQALKRIPDNGQLELM